jgi:hypothetical protein
MRIAPERGVLHIHRSNRGPAMSIIKWSQSMDFSMKVFGTRGKGCVVGFGARDRWNLVSEINFNEDDNSELLQNRSQKNISTRT